MSVGDELWSRPLHCKPYNPTALLLHRRDTKRMQPQSTSLIQYHGLQIDLNKWTITKEGQTTHLTKNEQLIFKCYGSIGKIVRELLMTDFGITMSLSMTMLSVNISRLRQKFAIWVADVIETKKNKVL